jgi:hypothetical protein
MTVEELIDKLNKSTSDIEGLPSAPLSAPQGVRWAIADALKHAVRPSATVRDGLKLTGSGMKVARGREARNGS